MSEWLKTALIISGWTLWQIVGSAIGAWIYFALIHGSK